MKAQSDARFAFLRDPDLCDLVGRLALKRVRHEAFADDVRNGAYVVAMQLVLGGRGPKPGTERGWLCRVARNHTFEALRARKDEEKPLETDDEPDIPVEDQPTLLASQMEIEHRFNVVEEIASQHPAHVEEALGGDARTKEGARHAGAKDAAARKRRERARTFLASAVSSALAVVIAILYLRGPGAPKPALPAGGYATRRRRRPPARGGELRGAAVGQVPRRSRATEGARRVEDGSQRAGGVGRGGRGHPAGSARGVHEERLHDVPRGARHGEAVRSGRRERSECAAREKRGGAAAAGIGGAGVVEGAGCEAGAAAVAKRSGQAEARLESGDACFEALRRARKTRRRDGGLATGKGRG
jgi:DNA-directed RNA polymerase specialized sigma24 family protein